MAVVSRLTIISIWVAATVVVTVLAWQIVAAAGEQVSPGPQIPVGSLPVTTPPSSTTTPSTTSTSTTSPTTTRPTTATTKPSQGGTSSTSTTTTTTAGSNWSVKTIPTSGGTVVVSYRPEEVVLNAATPAPGYSTDIGDAGPPKVRVEFESDESKVEVRVEWDGQLVVEVRDDD